jgi:hypothetical protein
MESFQQFVAVFFVLGGLLATLMWLRRRGFAAGGGVLGRLKPSSGERRLQAVERLPLTATHTLHLVRIADREILIATSPAGCQVVECR